MWEAEATTPTVSTVRLKYRKGSEWEQWVLLSADRHFDNPKSNQKLQIKHLRQAKERDAIVVDCGDLFCAMQGKYDPRSSKKDVRPENMRGDYLDSLIDSGADLFGPYAEQFALILSGNHESAILKRMETDLTARLVKRLNAMGSQVIRGGYRGWVRFLFEHRAGGHRQSIKMYCSHGAGGNAPVTKGIIQTNRRAVVYPDADIICTGHIHEGWQFPILRCRVSDQGIEYADEQLHICIPTYKEEYFGEASGFHHEKEGPPKPIGAWWLRFFWDRDYGRIQVEATRAR